MSFKEYTLLDGEDGEVAKALVAIARHDRSAVEDFMLQFEAFVRMGRPFLDRVFPDGAVVETDPPADTEIFYVPPRYFTGLLSPMAALVTVDNLARTFRIAALFDPATPPPDHAQLAGLIAAATAGRLP